eukprot:gene6451-biopygen16401
MCVNVCFCGASDVVSPHFSSPAAPAAPHSCICFSSGVHGAAPFLPSLPRPGLCGAAKSKQKGLFRIWCGGKQHEKEDFYLCFVHPCEPRPYDFDVDPLPRAHFAETHVLAEAHSIVAVLRGALAHAMDSCIRDRPARGVITSCAWDHPQGT